MSTSAFAATFTTVIGLEVHVQLLTQTKLFCGCLTKFGAPPNTQTCPICIGMPGVLPVMNRRAFELALKAAVALNCDISAFTKWDRKNYYYPDLPKNYQISQYDLPFSHDGYLEIPAENGDELKRIGIIRVHLEEDAGKLLHSETGGDSQVDLNRTGTPLLEIVSMPDLRSPKEAKTYLEELRLLLRYLEVSDCNMQEGSLRVDANVNIHVHTDGELIPTPIVEVKNMNSFRAVERAMIYEAERQFEDWKQTGHRLGDVPKETRGWDETRGVTALQRHKEEASDYRYFPEPDLVPVTVDEAQVEPVRASIGELPADRRHRFEIEYQLPAYDADVLIEQGRPLADYFEDLVRASGSPKDASNWMMQDVLRTLNERGSTIDQFSIPAESLGGLIRKVVDGALNTTNAREVFAEMLSTGRPADEIIASRGLAQISDTDKLRSLAEAAVDANPKALADFKKGKKPEQVIGWLTGQVMRQTSGQANAAVVRQILAEILARRAK